MHERLEMKTHPLGVALSAGWPLALAFLLLCGMVLLLFPAPWRGPVIAVLAAAVALTFLWCLKLYMGVYLFLPATEYKGARIIARLGRNSEIEISGVLAEELIVKQGWMEKRLGVCHIRQKGTVIYLRGVREPEKVKVWIAANFPKERKAPPVKAKHPKKH